MESTPSRNSPSLDTLSRASRYIALLLRHKPEVGDITLDDEGWASTSSLLKAVGSKYPDFNKAHLITLVDNDSKRRYQFKTVTCEQIRAVQGHSIKVDLKLVEKAPPAVLYHGTKTSSLESIFEQGLRPMSRTHVHLSKDFETASQVANRRKSGSCVLTIHTGNAFADGIKFYLADNGVWLSDPIPSAYISHNVHYLKPT